MKDSTFCVRICEAKPALLIKFAYLSRHLTPCQRVALINMATLVIIMLRLINAGGPKLSKTFVSNIISILLDIQSAGS